MFTDFRVFETELAGRPLKVEVGKMAQLAAGSCLVRYGETEVLCSVTMADKPREGVDFFPMSVDFEEKLYSVGKIPGSFQSREGRATDKAILASRCIDRPIRPLFPKDMRNDCSVVATVMSVDPDCSPEITAMIGVSIALSISQIPWDGPVSSVSLGLVDGEYVINPTVEQREKTQMTVTVASTADLVAMIEAGANEISNEVMFDGIMYAHEENKKIVRRNENITYSKKNRVLLGSVALGFGVSYFFLIFLSTILCHNAYARAYDEQVGLLGALFGNVCAGFRADALAELMQGGNSIAWFLPIANLKENLSLLSILNLIVAGVAFLSLAYCTVVVIKNRKATDKITKRVSRIYSVLLVGTALVALSALVKGVGAVAGALAFYAFYYGFILLALYCFFERSKLIEKGL